MEHRSPARLPRRQSAGAEAHREAGGLQVPFAGLSAGAAPADQSADHPRGDSATHPPFGVNLVFAREAGMRAVHAYPLFLWLKTFSGASMEEVTRLREGREHS